MEISWKTVTGNLYKSVLIQTWCKIAASITTFISILSLLNIVHTDNISNVIVLNIWDILTIVANIGLICGLLIFFLNLKKWKALVAEKDAKAIGDISSATALNMFTVIAIYIPLLSDMASILNFIIFIILLISYNRLKNSATLPAGTKRGASKIFTAMILDLVGTIIYVITLIGIFDGLLILVGIFTYLILSIIALFMILSGWKCIANSEQA